MCVVLHLVMGVSNREYKAKFLTSRNFRPMRVEQQWRTM